MQPRDDRDWSGAGRGDQGDTVGAVIGVGGGRRPETPAAIEGEGRDVRQAGGVDAGRRARRALDATTDVDEGVRSRTGSRATSQEQGEDERREPAADHGG